MSKCKEWDVPECTGCVQGESFVHRYKIHRCLQCGHVYTTLCKEECSRFADKVRGSRLIYLSESRESPTYFQSQWFSGLVEQAMLKEDLPPTGVCKYH